MLRDYYNPLNEDYCIYECVKCGRYERAEQYCNPEINYSLEKTNNIEYGYMAKKSNASKKYVDLSQGGWGEPTSLLDSIEGFIKVVDPSKEIKKSGRRQFSDEWSQIEAEWLKIEKATKKLAKQQKDLDERERKLALKPTARLKEALETEAHAQELRDEVTAGQERLRRDKRSFAARCRNKEKEIATAKKAGEAKLAKQRKQLDKDRDEAQKLYKKQKDEIDHKLQKAHDRKMSELQNEISRLRSQRHEQSDKEAELIAREMNILADEAAAGKTKKKVNSSKSRIEL